MLLFKTEIRISPIAGKGVFTCAFIPRGSVIGFFPHQRLLVSEAHYCSLLARGDAVVSQTGVRWVGPFFSCADSLDQEFRNEDYINHAEEPSMLCHCGVLFALRDIRAGEELTTDYRYFVAPSEQILDSKTGRVVSGLDWRRALVGSAELLLKLYGSLPT
jgi:hypothetical protein